MRYQCKKWRIFGFDEFDYSDHGGRMSDSAAMEDTSLHFFEGRKIELESNWSC